MRVPLLIDPSPEVSAAQTGLASKERVMPTKTGGRRVMVTRATVIALLAAWSVGGSLAISGQPESGAVAVATPAAGRVVFYKGSIDLPGMALEFSLELTRGLDGTPTGTIDIPIQAFLDQPLLDVVWTETRLAFSVAVPGADESSWPQFDFALAGDNGADAAVHMGTLKQAGHEFPASIERTEAAAEGLKRPQVPVGPFPYEAREVTFRNEAGDLTIAGTLTVPDGDGPFPCAVMITGSGPQDRDETIFEHRPFLVIADHLARQGIAVLRCDDRDVGGTGPGNQEHPDSMDFVTDALASLEFVAAQDNIDATRLGLIGHSEGGLIAPLVAGQDERVTFVVMLAGPGVPGDEILMEQGEAIALAMGASAATLEEQRPIRRAFFDAVNAQDEAAAREAITRLLVMQGGDSMTEDTLEKAIEAQMEAFNTRWMRTFLSHDPRPALRAMHCPVLVLNGDRDLQVLHEQNVPEVEKALREGGNQDVTVALLPGINHMLQPSQTGSVMEYATIETTVDQSVLDAITTWIKARTGSPASAPGAASR